MICLILDGGNIYLRLLQKPDVDDFCVWYSDGHVTRFIGMNPLSQDSVKTLFNWILTDPNGVYFSIIKKDFMDHSTVSMDYFMVQKSILVQIYTIHG